MLNWYVILTVLTPYGDTQHLSLNARKWWDENNTSIESFNK